MGYDRRESPINIPGSNQSILGKNGLVDAAGGFVQNLTDGNFLGAIKKAGTAYNTFKNTDLKSTLKGELTNMAIQSIRDGVQNPRGNVSLPVAGGTPGAIGTAGAPTTGAKAQPSTVGGDKTAGIQYNPQLVQQGVNKVVDTAITKPLLSIGKALSGGG